MGKFVIARQLAGKILITNRGDRIGRLLDLVVNEVTGKITNLVAEPDPDNALARKLRKEDGNLVLPYSSVLSVSDFIILDEKALAS